MRVKLKRLRVVNFLSYSSLDTEIPEGVVVIVGPNGAGKSSFVDAIAYALTGSAVSRKISSKRELLTRGASEGRVELTLEIDEKKVEVMRTVSTRRTTDAYVRENGSIVARGAQPTDKYLAAALGFTNTKVLREVVFVPQGKLTELIELKPSELKTKVLELLGLKDKEAVERGLREVVSYYKGSVRALRGFSKSMRNSKKSTRR